MRQQKKRSQRVSGGVESCREMLRFLQRRKFRLVTLWKARLKENITFQLPAGPDFPYRLVFRAFDEIIHLLKLELCGLQRDSPASLLVQIPSAGVPNADQFMEMFLTGRDVLEEFVAEDEIFRASFSDSLRDELRAAVEHAFKQLVEWEMSEYSRRVIRGLMPEPSNPA